ncbi:hypothetical protein BJ965_006619 [Streptomyces luteogriseus]|uniref:Thioesterase domain-containing protein n=1 Tax=Streptomyces luteogriseus TaxID=68233 RepID=A0A7W7DU22_9ACTN|nr:hypothetical protein [Streptomyces luteogriseus]MBB4716737.1 hypothetical protein [Streptomyces luteogriseus]
MSGNTPPLDGRPVVVIEFGNEIPPRSFDPVLPPELHARRLRIDPLRYPGLAETVPDLATQARHWAAEIATAAPPQAVLAYCSAVELAHLLAGELPVPGIPLVVLDPVLPGPGTPRELLLDLALDMDDTLDPAEVPDITGLPASEALRQASVFLRSLVTRTAPDLDEDIADELTQAQRAWLGFTLSAAAERTAPPKLGHVILSEGSEWPDSDALSVHHTGLNVKELFGTPAVTPLLSELLSAAAAGSERGKEDPCSRTS